MIENIYLEAYKRLPLKDIDHASFSSDLYLRLTPESKKIVLNYKWHQYVKTFIDNIDHVLWYEIPFAFPYKIFEETDKGIITWYFLHYDEEGNHVYYNGLCNVRVMAEHYAEWTLTLEELEKYI